MSLALQIATVDTMAHTSGTNLSSSLSTNDFSTTDNGTALKSKIYVFSPIGSTIQFTIFSCFVTVGIVGLVGNILVLCFLKTKNRTKSFLRMCSFERNFKVYIASLAISDVLSVLVSIPLMCIHLFLDLLQRGWSCKIARYFTLVFPRVTMYNLLVMTIEKYFASRKIPRTFRLSTVKKMVLFAWLAGSLIVCLSASTFDGMRFDVNDTHYTVVCRYDNHYLPFRIIYISYVALQFIIPMIIMMRLNISLIITVWRLMRRQFDAQRDNGIKMKARAASIRRTFIIIALTFAFIFPYFPYMVQTIYNNATKAIFDFETDLTIRGASAVLAVSNPAVNFVLYLVQMKDFRAFVKKLFSSRCLTENPNPEGVDNAGIEPQ